MTNFRAMLKDNPPTLTDEQVDELIALQDGELIYKLGMYASMSKASEAKMRREITRWQPVQRTK